MAVIIWILVIAAACYYFPIILCFTYMTAWILWEVSGEVEEWIRKRWNRRIIRKKLWNTTKIK